MQVHMFNVAMLGTKPASMTAGTTAGTTKRRRCTPSPYLLTYSEKGKTRIFPRKGPSCLHVSPSSSPPSIAASGPGSTSSCAGYTNDFEWDSVFAAKCVQQLVFLVKCVDKWVLETRTNFSHAEIGLGLLDAAD
jgi:hypothetical protein